jgi:glutathione S-transferase
MIKIYGVPLSPFVRKALLALEYKGLDYENEPTFPGDESPAFRAISPLGKIPVLEHDGFTVPDTSVICRYLDRRRRSASTRRIRNWKPRLCGWRSMRTHGWSKPAPRCSASAC